MTTPSSTAPNSPMTEAKSEPYHLPYVLCREQSAAYERIGQVGKGQFGYEGRGGRLTSTYLLPPSRMVFKMRDKETRALVALKKILMAGETEGVCWQAHRCLHQNITPSFLSFL